MRGALRAACSAVRRPALRRIAAPRHAATSATPSRRCSSSPTPRAFRWSPPTSRIFARREDYEAHDALICIAEGRVVAETDRRQLTRRALLQDAAPRWRRCSPTCPRRSPRRSRSPSAARSGRRRASRSCRASPVGRHRGRRGGGAAPRRPRQGSSARIADASASRPGAPIEDYRERLAFELGVIERMKYPGYFLIVADFIQWAKEQGIPVGPGRGSGAGSLVAYALTITDLDPIRFGLLFERFLNPERVSMPDFDIDFCQDRRDEVIHYVQERYGRDQVGADHHLRHPAGARRAARRRPRAGDALRAGRQALQAGAAEPGSAGDAREGDRRASRGCRPTRDAKPVVRRAFDIAQKLEGLLPPRLDPCRRHRDRRPAAVRAGAAVSRSEIRHAGHPVQHEMGRAGGAGEVRLPRPEDADGAADRGASCSSSAASISTCRHPARRQPRPTRCWRAARRSASSRWKGQGMRRALLDMQPDRFEDIIALVALYRPGPMANIPTYCARKQGTEKPEYIHPKLEPILRETYGVIVYQEQVMQARADPRRLFARRGRSAAPRHGQEDHGGDGGAARALRQGRDRARRRAGHRPRRSSTCSSASPTTASTRATPRPTRWSPTRPPT